MAEYVHQLAADHLIHAWDVAAATGGDTSLDPELVDDVATWFAEREQLYRGAGIIGERVETGRTTRQTVSSPRSAATLARADGPPYVVTALVIGACA